MVTACLARTQEVIDEQDGTVVLGQCLLERGDVELPSAGEILDVVGDDRGAVTRPPELADVAAPEVLVRRHERLDGGANLATVQYPDGL